METKLSVIIPVYNAQAFLEKCIESVLTQSFTDFELILVNDGSVDASGQICNSFAAKDHRVNVIHQKNQGVSNARNNGLNNACGQYVAFIDSDDWVEPDFFQAYFDELKNNPTQLMYQGFTNDFHDRVSYLHLPHKRYRDESITEALYEVEFRECLGGACNKLFEKKIIEENKIRFDPQISYGEDKIFTLQYCLNINSITLLDCCYYHYNRAQDTSLSNTHHSSKKLEILLEIEHKLFNRINEKYFNEKFLKAINGRYVSFSKYALISMYRPTENRDKSDRLNLLKKIHRFMNSNVFDTSFDRDVPKVGGFLIGLKSDWGLKLMMSVRYRFNKIYLLFRSERTK
ncbi:glycosyltransferase family 2 protein [Mucilaginibacter agri]|uniref:Glycosyltransferase n=1 Tax=Mucilaginibacter agri TaxID=2695265 RepID=A0A965ZGQ0_9SPHI|nr:glycosyltransferase [Mucilaginibacter agri]NCD70743.1 glycosyltransferase [Mucilaginibacter agri]